MHDVIPVEELLDPAAMRPVLVARAGAAPDARCRVLDAKYEAGQSATVLFEVGTRLVTVLADAAGFEAFVFPDDPVLASLPSLIAPGPMAERLSRILNLSVVACRPRLVRYRAAKRATLAVAMRVLEADRLVNRQVFVKVYSNTAKAEAVFAEGRALWMSVTAAGCGDLVLAEPLAFDEEVGMIVQATIGAMSHSDFHVGADTARTSFPLKGLLGPMDNLDSLLAVAPSGRLDLRAGTGLAGAARAIAAVHREEPVSTRSRTSETELRRFAARAGRIEATGAAVGSHLVALAGDLAQAHRNLPPPAVGLVHGDCKPSQFLVAHSRRDGHGSASTGLLDFDHCGLADPAYDVGSFLAALRKRHLTQSSQLGDWPGRVFLDTYCRAVDKTPDFSTLVGWHEAAALMRKSLRAFARAPRSPLPRLLATEATAVLARTV